MIDNLLIKPAYIYCIYKVTCVTDMYQVYLAKNRDDDSDIVPMMKLL